MNKIYYPRLKNLFGCCIAAFTSCILLSSENSIAQAPIITSVSASTGIPGSSATISGNHFNTTPGNNVVFFGATQATVVGGTDSTVLNVTIPVGATYLPVSVLNTGRRAMAYQQYPFVPEYNNACFTPGAFNFKPKVDFAAGIVSGNPIIAAMGDFNGDGKVDLAVANRGSSKLMIYQNSSTSGSITSGSFTAVDSMLLIGSPDNIKVADLDGDGKLDLVVSMHGTANIAAIRNITSGSTISFIAVPRYVSVSGTSASEVVVADFDKDGRIDIGSVDAGNGNISILLNAITSIPGSGTGFVGGSFSSYATFSSCPSSGSPISMCAADFDGDGKIDLAVSDELSATINVLLNTTSTAGTVSFGSYSSFSVGSSVYSLEVQAADIDGDGKMDLLVPCTNGSSTNYVSVLRNTSSGSANFATHTDFSTGGTDPGALAIGDIDGDGKLDVAVSNNGSNSITLFRNTSSSGSVTLTSTATLSTGPGPIGLSIGDLDGDTFPDLVAANNTSSNTISVFRNNPLPKIDSITGPSNICIASAVIDTFKDTISGGTWSVTNGHATINASTGRVTAVSSGLDTVVYMIVCSGDTSIMKKPFSVNAAPTTAGIISGASVVCATNNITLTSSVTGGTWGVTAATSSYATVGASTGIVTGTAVGTAQITYTVSNACGSVTATHNVAVHAASGAITGSSTVCAGASTTLHTSSSGGTWSSSDYSIATIGSAGIVTGGVVGSATITYTASGGCYSTFPISISTSPALISGSGSVCLGLSTTLSDASGSGTWSSSNTSIATIDPSTGVVSGASVGLDTIYYTAYGCSAARPFNVNALPAAISGLTEVCAGSNLTFTDASTPGVWTSGTTAVATITSTGASAASLHAIAAGTTEVTYTLSATGCIATTSVTVDPIPSPITGTSSVCVHGTTTLSEASSGGAWSTGSTAIATVSSTGVVTGVSAGTTTIIYTFSSTSCATSQTVTVNPLPAAITGISAICPGQTLTLHDATTSGGWTTSNAGVATISSGPGLLTGVAGGTATITYTLFATGCYNTASVTIRTAPDPIMGYDSVCNGFTSTLSDAVSGGIWTSVSPAIATVDSFSGTATGLAPGTTTISYTIPPYGCATSVSFVVDPILVPSVSISFSSSSTTVCQGPSVLYTAHPVNGGSAPAYVWQVNGVVTGTGPTFLYVPANGDVIKCTLTSSGPCLTSPTAFSSITMTVNPLVTPAVTLRTSAGGDTTCTGVMTTIIPTPVNGGSSPSFVWKVNSVTVWTGATWSYVPANGDVISVVMTTDVACPRVDTAVDTLLITVSPYLTPSVVMLGSDTACQGYPAIFTAVPTNGGYHPTFEWSLNTINVASGPTFAYHGSTGDVVAVTMTSDFPCLTTPTVTCTPRTMTVINVPLPSLTMVAWPGYIAAPGAPITLIAHPKNPGTSPTYTWFKNGVIITGAASDTIYVAMGFSSNDSFVCRLTNNDYCDGITAFAAQKVFVGNNVGVSQVNMEQAYVNVIPNPTTGSFEIKGLLATNADESVEMDITNMLGQVVYKGKLEAKNGEIDARINLENTLSNGIYLLNVHSEYISRVVRFELSR